VRRGMGIVITVLVGATAGFATNDVPPVMTESFSFRSSIVVQGVSNDAAHVQIRFATPCDPLTPDYEVHLAPAQRAMVDVNEAVPGPWEASPVVTSDVPIVAATSLTWLDPRGGTQWAVNSGGVAAPSQTWYLSGGRTDSGYQSYVVVLNPSTELARVGVSFITSGGTSLGGTYTLNPTTRTEVDVADTLPDTSSLSAVVTSDVPVVAQMSTYWNGGLSTSSSMGVSAPATEWYLPEGSTSTWSGFETFIHVMNPSDSTAQIEIEYVADGTTFPGAGFNVAPMTQHEFNVADDFPDRPQFSAVVTSDVPIVAVQSMYWDKQRGYDETMGMPGLSTQWHFPQSRPGEEFSSWIAVQNVGGEPTSVSVNYVTESGTEVGPSLDLGPYERQSVSLPESVVDTLDFSITVTSAEPILAHQGTYWECGNDVHRSLQFGTTLAARDWYLPITPREPPITLPIDSGSADSQMVQDSDGDGIPDAIDLCPQFPGTPAMDGC
jgi:hypothetical protein